MNSLGRLKMLLVETESCLRKCPYEWTEIYNKLCERFWRLRNYIADLEQEYDRE